MPYKILQITLDYRNHPIYPFMNLVEYPIAYTIRYRRLSIIHVQSLIQRLMEFLIEYPRDIRYIICAL